ncbi:MAG: PHP domain-containing protein [Flavobacteriia bacterium]|nr:PHP domain-containing protein [Flavobacteriia bacterium]
MTGAKFLRADLHIHSFGEFGSYDVTDRTMTPEAIVDKAIEKNLSIISITDHNEIQNVNTALNHANGKPILVIPGIEVSTTQGHLLVYFETFKNLRDFFGKLTISEDRKTCNQGIVECLELANQHSGLGILAHIELDSGFEKTIGRFGPQIEEVFKHPNLKGLEISSKSSVDFYTDNDTDDNRKRLLKLRREHLGLDINLDLPKLMSSDSHTLSKLGVNADGEKKLTRIKIDELNFHSFKVALLSHESRIRLENFIPEQRPVIRSIKLDGGLLDNINIDLNPNLTCIIGSRGAGKSTLLEAIRESSGNTSNAKVVDSDVWPQEIKLTFEDEAGQIIEFKRDKNDALQNISDPINGITKVDIESYGQGETASTIQHSDENPSVLVSFLDSFLELSILKSNEREIVDKLLENQSESKKLRIELLGLPETKKALINEQKKLASLQKEKAGELVKFQNALIKEREIRSSLISDLNDLVKTYREILNDNSTFESFESLSEDEIVVGKDFFNRVKEIVSEFSAIVKDKSTELNTALSEKVKDLKEQLKNWSEKEKEIQGKIDTKKKELEDQGIPFDLGKINQISKDIIHYTAKVKKLEASKNLLDQFEKDRKELIKERKELKDKIYYQRFAFAQSINGNLKNTLDGLLIDVKYEQGKYSSAFEDELKSLMDWRTSQVPKSPQVVRQITPLELVEAALKNDRTKLESIVSSDGSQLLSSTEISNMIQRLKVHHKYEDFESIEFDDLPSITVTKIFKDEQGKTIRNSKTISQLSLGQQQSVLLAILMLSKSKKPLIIDQPEDNLDSEFIFKTIVINLRKIKEARQVIIVTHNPNIAVLGDAELIIPLKSTSVKSHVLQDGSIDRETTREICCEILEGGKSAFKQRQELYGI